VSGNPNIKLNGSPVERGPDVENPLPHQLNDRDMLIIGGKSFRFECGSRTRLTLSGLASAVVEEDISASPIPGSNHPQPSPDDSSLLASPGIRPRRLLNKQPPPNQLFSDDDINCSR